MSVVVLVGYFVLLFIGATKLDRRGVLTDNFAWTNTATEAFLKLKTAMITIPILCLLDFSKQFVMKVDASGVGVGVVLM